MGESIQFTDTSAGNPTSWQWSFGDGATSTAQESDPQLYDCGVQDRDFGGRQWPWIKQRQSNRYGRRAIRDHCRPFEHKVGPHPRDLDRPGQAEAPYRLRPYLARKPARQGWPASCLGGGALFVQLGGRCGALDLRDTRRFGRLVHGHDLGNPNRTAWESATRTYLARNPTINVIIWSWCGQVDGTEAKIQQYLDLMNGLEHDFPNVKFVYMTGHMDGAALTGNVPPATSRSATTARRTTRSSTISPISRATTPTAITSATSSSTTPAITTATATASGTATGPSTGRTPIRASGTIAIRPTPSR